MIIYHCDSQKPVGQTPYTNQSKLVSDPGIGSACCKKAKPTSYENGGQGLKFFYPSDLKIDPEGTSILPSGLPI